MFVIQYRENEHVQGDAIFGPFMTEARARADLVLHLVAIGEDDAAEQARADGWAMVGRDQWSVLHVRAMT